jgi:tetratricopeptide (TPR) repeat protein
MSSFLGTSRHPGASIRLVAVVAAVAASAWLALHAPAAHADAKPDGITEAEVALLPPYCRDANTIAGYGDASYNTSPNAPKWVALMGKGFWAIHHYCWALINLARIQRPSVPYNERQWKRESAIADLDYVIQHSDPDMILLPEIYTKKGEIYLVLKRYSQADEAYAKARELKPDYWPAYYQWAEYLRTAGQKEKARQMVEQGLAHAPNNKALTMLLRTLGGDASKTQRRVQESAAANESATN